MTIEESIKNLAVVCGFDEKRCDVCSWTLVDSINKGCTLGNCSMRDERRPHMHSEPLVLARKALRHLIAEARRAEGLIATLKIETEGRAEARQQLNLVKTDTEGVWRWQGNGDDPESLSCPVVMSADTLRAFVAEARKVEKVKAKYATLRPEVGGENYDVARAWDEGFHEAWEDVMLIIAPDAETKEVSRG